MALLGAAGAAFTAAAPAISAIGTVVSVAGQIQAGKDAKAAHDYNAQVADRNALVAEQQAEQLRLREEVQIVQFRKDFRKFSDAQAQAFRYNGWVASDGTPLKVALASAAEAEQEVSARRYNAALGEQALEESALEQRMSGNLQRMYVRRAQTAGFVGAGQSLLSGGSSYLQTQQFAGNQ